MFGFILPSLESLNDNEKQRYHAVYCGVCQSLKERYGQACRLTVSYDLTFMVLVLGSLYEPQEQSGAKRCPAHPCNPQQYVRSELSDYAADLSVALAYHKLMDNWYDDHSRLSRSGAAVLRGAYKKAKQRRPKSCATIETAMAEIRRLEQMADARALGALGEHRRQISYLPMRRQTVLDSCWVTYSCIRMTFGQQICDVLVLDWESSCMSWMQPWIWKKI